MRKKRNIFVWVAMAMALLITSCGDGEDTLSCYRSSHRVNDYVLPDSIIYLRYEMVDDGSFHVAFSVDGELVSSGEKISSGSRHELFDSISGLYHDDHYKGEISGEESNRVVAFPITTVSIVSDMDYGEQYPAGCNLCDYSIFHGISLGKFVLNGYRFDESDNFLPYINKPYTELTDAEKCLWYGCIEFELPVVPTASHNLTVTISFEGGKTLTKMLRVEL